MANDLSCILRDVVSRAAKAPVAENEDLARLRKRFADCTDDTVVLCDCSGSMRDMIGHSGISKMEHLEIALNDLLRAHPRVILIAFSSTAQRVKNTAGVTDHYRRYGGSTNLTDAIEEAAKLRPRRTVIISDGLPDNADTATEAIDDLTGQVDCVYCGPDGHPAVAFLQSLARKGGGHQMTFDGCRELAPMIRGLLA